MPPQTRFSELLEAHQKEIYRYLYRMTGDPEDAADVLQETFLGAFQAFPKLDPGANHRAWLYRIAHRQALNLFRSQKVRRAASLDLVAEPDDPDLNPEELSETRRLARSLNQLIHALTPRQRSALLLKKYEGLAYSDVARVLGCSEETARAQVYQAMKKVRKGLH